MLPDREYEVGDRTFFSKMLHSKEIKQKLEVLVLGAMVLFVMFNWVGKTQHKVVELSKNIKALEQTNIKTYSMLKLQQNLVFSVVDIHDLRIKIAEEMQQRAGDLKPEDISEIAVVLAVTYKANPRMKPSVVMAVIQQESSFDPKAVSNKGAVGLMQIMPATARPYLRELGLPEDTSLLSDPVVNVKVGILHLQDLMRTYEEDNVAVNAYFWGVGNVNNFIQTGNQQVVDLKYGKEVLEKAKKYAEKGLI